MSVDDGMGSIMYDMSDFEEKCEGCNDCPISETILTIRKCSKCGHENSSVLIVDRELEIAALLDEYAKLTGMAVARRRKSRPGKVIWSVGTLDPFSCEIHYSSNEGRFCRIFKLSQDYPEIVRSNANAMWPIANAQGLHPHFVDVTMNNADGFFFDSRWGLFQCADISLIRPEFVISVCNRISAAMTKMLDLSMDRSEL